MSDCFFFVKATSSNCYASRALSALPAMPLRPIYGLQYYHADSDMAKDHCTIQIGVGAPYGYAPAEHFYQNRPPKMS